MQRKWTTVLNILHFIAPVVRHLNTKSIIRAMCRMYVWIDYVYIVQEIIRVQFTFVNDFILNVMLCNFSKLFWGKQRLSYHLVYADLNYHIRQFPYSWTLGLTKTCISSCWLLRSNQINSQDSISEPRQLISSSVVSQLARSFSVLNT